MPALPPSFRLDVSSSRLRLDPHDDAFVQEPYVAYAALHDRAPVFFWEDYGFSCCAGFDDVSRLLRDRRLGRQRPDPARDGIGVLGDRSHLADFDAVERFSLLELEPPFHTRLRALVNRAFVSRQVERLRPRIDAVARSLIDGFEAERQTELIGAFATPLPVAVIAELLGVPGAMGPQLVEWSHSMVAMYMHGRTRLVEDRANKAARDFTAFLRSTVAERRARPEDDLLSQLIATESGRERLTEDELVSSAILLLNAGHEATVHQIGNAVCAILSQGGDPRRFFRDDAGASATVEECLRFNPPLHLFTRTAYEAVELGPRVSLRPGEQVGLLLAAAGSDPRVFASPRTFDPARSDLRHAAFGAGIHFCVGAPLARLELTTALSVLFERLPGLRLMAPPRYRDSYHFHGLDRLEAAW